MKNVFDHVFENSVYKFAFKLFKDVVIAFLATSLSFSICKVIRAEGIYEIFLKAGISLTVSSIVIVLFTWKTEELRWSVKKLISPLAKARGKVWKR